MGWWWGSIMGILVWKGSAVFCGGYRWKRGFGEPLGEVTPSSPGCLCRITMRVTGPSDLLLHSDNCIFVCEDTNWWNVGRGELTIAIFVCSTLWGFLYGSHWLLNFAEVAWVHVPQWRRCGADGVVVSGRMMTWLLKAAAWDNNKWIFTCIWEFYVLLWSLMSVFTSSLFH